MGASRDPVVVVTATSRKGEEGEMVGDRDIVAEEEGMLFIGSLGVGQVLRLMRLSIKFVWWWEWCYCFWKPVSSQVTKLKLVNLSSKQPYSVPRKYNKQLLLLQ